MYIKAGDHEFDKWNDRGVNLRVKGTPSRIIPVGSVEELAVALQETVDKKQRLAVRCGGHCLENFVGDPAVESVIDISMMKGIRMDDSMNAVEIMAGNTLGEVHQKLLAEWDLFLPAGEHPAIGMGGHIPGGAFGFFCRQYGLGADYLYAVEIVWVNKNGLVEKTVATRDPADTNRELWWAHTGGGAGNFGIVTRYWFKDLPTAPEMIETAEIDWLWKDISEAGFQQLAGNFGDWCSRNDGPGDTGNTLFATLFLWNKAVGKIQLKAVLTHQERADEVLRDMTRALEQGDRIPYTLKRKKIPWLDFALEPFPDIFGGPKSAFKVKDAFLLQPFSTEQIATAYQYLANRDDTPGGFIGLATYGGKVNTVAPGETASAQRNAILETACTAGWQDPAEEAKYLDWVRHCYRDLYKGTGGVPVPGNSTGGCIIAHPDNDLADPAWNESGVPWYAFYYQDNYPRLQAVKAKWDPLNIFQHTLSVEPA
jgi:FAD/FMN-containing dehydrogenase